MKGKRLLLCIIAISFTILMFTGFKSVTYNEGTKVPNYKDVKIITKEKDAPKVARLVFEEYLKSYENKAVKDSLRLKDFKIDKIEKIRYLENYPDAFSFFVKYSVKADIMDSEWIKANGKNSLFNWKKDNYCYVELQCVNNRYTIKTLSETMGEK